MKLLVQLAETLQARVIDQGGRLNFRERTISPRRRRRSGTPTS